jgi:hypothetical protein
VYNDFIISGDPGIKGQPETAHFRFREARQIRQADPEAYFGVNLVDILSAGAAGPGKTYGPFFPDGITQLGYVHGGSFHFPFEILNFTGLFPGEFGPAEMAVGGGFLVDGPPQVQRFDDPRGA